MSSYYIVNKVETDEYNIPYIKETHVVTDKKCMANIEGYVKGTIKLDVMPQGRSNYIKFTSIPESVLDEVKNAAYDIMEKNKNLPYKIKSDMICKHVKDNLYLLARKDETFFVEMEHNTRYRNQFGHKYAIIIADVGGFGRFFDIAVEKIKSVDTKAEVVFLYKDLVKNQDMSLFDIVFICTRNINDFQTIKNDIHQFMLEQFYNKSENKRSVKQEPGLETIIQWDGNIKDLKHITANILHFFGNDIMMKLMAPVY